MRKGDAKKAFYETELKQHENSLGEAYGYVSEGKTMFYAGGYEYDNGNEKVTNWSRAEKYAHDNGMRPIVKTKAGGYLNDNKTKLNNHFGVGYA